MTFLQKAINELGIEKQYETAIKYSDHFNDYGANIKVYPDRMILKLSRAWRPISEEIKIGLAQELLVGLFKLKKNTMNIDLYNNFVRSLHLAIPKHIPEPVLLSSFNRVNEKYFSNSMEMPNIVWGDYTTRKLGSYDYKKDTITLSRVLENKPEFIDLVMHHELLHKKHKFRSANGRSLHHSAAFRKEERSFENFEEIERQLKKHLAKTSFKRFLGLY
jgi:predicted SprT family Zn-dependent metalloprotease